MKIKKTHQLRTFNFDFQVKQTKQAPFQKWYFVTKIVPTYYGKKLRNIYFDFFFQRTKPRQSRISKVFLDNQNNFFSQQVRTILVTKYHFTINRNNMSLLASVGTLNMPPVKDGRDDMILESLLQNILCSLRSLIVQTFS